CIFYRAWKTQHYLLQPFYCRMIFKLIDQWKIRKLQLCVERKCSLLLPHTHSPATGIHHKLVFNIYFLACQPVFQTGMTSFTGGFAEVGCFTIVCDQNIFAL